jgi:hypothetical protein
MYWVYVPWKPVAHWHVYDEVPDGRQTPPFRHGAALHAVLVDPRGEKRGVTLGYNAVDWKLAEPQLALDSVGSLTKQIQPIPVGAPRE